MSKGLKALKTILQWFDDEHLGLDENVKESEEYQTIEKELKALEIIKNKFEISKPIGIDIENNTVSCGSLIQKKDLTQEEYDLLKEVLL